MITTVGKLALKIQRQPWSTDCETLMRHTLNVLDKFDENGREEIAVALTGQADAFAQAGNAEAEHTGDPTDALEYVTLTACDLVRIMQAVHNEIHAEKCYLYGPSVHDAIL